MTKIEIAERFQDVREEYIEEILPYAIHRKGHRRRIITLGLIAAAVLLLGMTAYAASQPVVLAKWFPRYFASQEEATEEMTRNQAEILDKGLVPIEKSQTRNGYTITLQSGISDHRRAILIFEVAAPEGVVLDSDTCILDSTIDVEIPALETGNYASVIRSGFQIPDENPFDNRFLVAKEIAVQPSEGSHFSLADGAIGVIRINSLLDSSGKAPQVIAEGPWEFSCKFSEEWVVMQEKEMLQRPVKAGALRSLNAGQYQATVTVTSFQLRSLSATCTYKIPFSGRWEGILLKPIYVVMKDGSKIPAHFVMSLNRGRTDECTYDFDRPIAIADVDHIEFTK